VTNGDGIFADQNVFNQESHDSLAFDDTKRFSSAAQASKECGEGFCQAQKCSAIVGPVGDRLQLSTECLLALTQHRHALTQLLDRQESFLIGVEQSFDTFANMGQFPLQTLLPFFGGIRGACCYQPPIKFLLYQSWLFQQGSPQPRRSDRGVLVGRSGRCRKPGRRVSANYRSQCTCSSESCVRWFASMFARTRSHTSHN
jgi:hypothetical protein